MVVVKRRVYSWVVTKYLNIIRMNCMLQNIKVFYNPKVTHFTSLHSQWIGPLFTNMTDLHLLVLPSGLSIWLALVRSNNVWSQGSYNSIPIRCLKILVFDEYNYTSTAVFCSTHCLSTIHLAYWHLCITFGEVSISSFSDHLACSSRSINECWTVRTQDFDVTICSITMYVYTYTYTYVRRKTYVSVYTYT
jgi:hypothetical protein